MCCHSCSPTFVVSLFISLSATIRIALFRYVRWIDQFVLFLRYENVSLSFYNLVCCSQQDFGLQLQQALPNNPDVSSAHIELPFVRRSDRKQTGAGCRGCLLWCCRRKPLSPTTCCLWSKVMAMSLVAMRPLGAVTSWELCWCVSMLLQSSQIVETIETGVCCNWATFSDSHLFDLPNMISLPTQRINLSCSTPLWLLGTRDI